MTSDVSRWRLLKVLEVRNKHNQKVGLYQCDCGTIKEVVIASVKGGRSKSCGCLHIEQTISFNNSKSTHGMTNSRVYKIWTFMKDRCLNPNANKYKDYGSRGIKVCNRWLESFENFYTDMGSPPTIKHSIDRINVNGNYEISNCRWATQKDQCRNTRRSRLFTISNQTKCLAEWCEIYSMNYQTVSGRLRRGWDIEKALTQAVSLEQ